MGSGEAKKFRDQFGSAGRHGESFWAEEKDNVGMRLLKSMGWKDGQGLGKDNKGRVTAVKQFRKKDNAGIGSSAGTRDEAYRASQDLFNDVLARLSGGGTAAASDSKDGASTLGSAATSIKGAMARRQISRRFCKAKMNASMDEILGRREEVAAAEVAEPAEGSAAVTDGLKQTTSKGAVSDYFARRRAAMGIASREQQSGRTDSSGPAHSARIAGFTLDDQARFAVGQVERSYSGRRGLGLGGEGGSSSGDEEQPQFGLGSGRGAAATGGVQQAFAPPAAGGAGCVEPADEKARQKAQRKAERKAARKAA